MVFGVLRLINVSIASICGFLMNFLLLYLIQKQTPTAMRSYARIMRQILFASPLLYMTNPVQIVEEVLCDSPSKLSRKIFEHFCETRVDGIK